jgi:hypothetical protein
MVIVILLGLVGWMVYRDHHKVTTTNTTPITKSTKQASPTTATSAQLIAVAEKVYYQQSAASSSEPSMTFCHSACPFTSSLTATLNGIALPTGSGPLLIAGQQNGPFGNVSYSATPSSTGGTVAVTVTPTSSEESAGNGIETFKLSIINSSGVLLVNDITYTSTAATKANPNGCGPVDLTNSLQCS